MDKAADTARIIQEKQQDTSTNKDWGKFGKKVQVEIFHFHELRQEERRSYDDNCKGKFGFLVTQLILYWKIDTDQYRGG